MSSTWARTQRLGPAPRAGRAHGRPAALRRAPLRQRHAQPGEPALGPGRGPLHPQGRGRGGLGAPLHLPRLPLVEVTGFPGTPKLDSIAAGSSIRPSEPVGSFAASKDIAQRLQRISLGPEDNSTASRRLRQRDERMAGWRRQGTARKAIMTSTWRVLYEFVRDIRDVQEPGRSRTRCPTSGLRAGRPGWARPIPHLLVHVSVLTATRASSRTTTGSEVRRVPEEHGRERNLKWSHYATGSVEKCPTRRFVVLLLLRHEILRTRPRHRKTADAASTNSWPPRSGRPSTAILRTKSELADGTQTANTLPLSSTSPPRSRAAPGPALRRHRLQARLASDHRHHRYKYIMELLTRNGASTGLRHRL